MHDHYEMRLDANGQSYIVKLAEQDGLCREVVFANGAIIHYAEFPASSLGDAKRGEYLRAMGASIAAKHKREGLTDAL